MKKLSRIKLNEVADEELTGNTMNSLHGGGDYWDDMHCCGCGCNYENTPGGSSSMDNQSANTLKGLSSYGGSSWCILWEDMNHNGTCDFGEEMDHGSRC